LRKIDCRQGFGSGHTVVAVYHPPLLSASELPDGTPLTRISVDSDGPEILAPTEDVVRALLQSGYTVESRHPERKFIVLAAPTDDLDGKIFTNTLHKLGRAEIEIVRAPVERVSKLTRRKDGSWRFDGDLGLVKGLGFQ